MSAFEQAPRGGPGGDPPSLLGGRQFLLSVEAVTCRGQCGGGPQEWHLLTPLLSEVLGFVKEEHLSAGMHCHNYSHVHEMFYLMLRHGP